MYFWRFTNQHQLSFSEFTLQEKALSAGFGGQAASLIRPGRGGRGSNGGVGAECRLGGGGTSRGEPAGRLQWYCPPRAGASISLVTGLKARGYVMESQSFQCKLQLLLPLMPVTHIRGWARNPEGRFSPCSPLLETGGARARSQGVRGAVYLRPACPGTSIYIFSSWWLRTAGSIRSHWAPAIDYLTKKKKKKNRHREGRLCLRLSDSEVVSVCVCARGGFFFSFSFFFPPPFSFFLSFFLFFPLLS